MSTPNIAAPGPGGVIVDSINALNAMKKGQHEQEYAGYKSQYAPLTIPAQALSQLAYSNSVIPQYVAKALGNPAIAAAMSKNGTDQNALRTITQFGQGQGTGMNLLNSLQNGTMPQQGQSPGARLVNHILDMFGVKGGESQQQNQQGNGAPNLQYMNNDPNDMTANGDTLAPGQDPNEYVRNNNVNSHNYVGNQVQQEPGVSTNAPGTPSPLTDEDINGMSAQTIQGILKTGSPENKQRINDFLNGNQKSTTAPQPGSARQTFSEVAADTEAAKAYKVELSKLNAGNLDEIGKQNLALNNSGASLDRMIGIIKNPEFQTLRDTVPFFQDKQLGLLSKTGSKEQQDLIGDFISTSQSMMGDAVNAFQGKAMAREFDYAQRLKINDNDTVAVAEGKLRALKTLKEIAIAKNDLIMDKIRASKGTMDLGQAVKEANKELDIKPIEKQVNQLLEPRIKLNVEGGGSIWVTKSEAKRLVEGGE